MQSIYAAVSIEEKQLKAKWKSSGKKYIKTPKHPKKNQIGTTIIFMKSIKQPKPNLAAELLGLVYL